MSHYRYVHQCDKCKKVYSRYNYITLNDLFLYGVCPKCGAEGKILRVIARPKLFGLRGWEIKEEE